MYAWALSFVSKLAGIMAFLRKNAGFYLGLHCVAGTLTVRTDSEGTYSRQASSSNHADSGDKQGVLP